MKRSFVIVLTFFALGCVHVRPQSDPESQSSVVLLHDSLAETISPIQAPQLKPGWSVLQRDSALTVLQHFREVWSAIRPPRYRYWQEGSCFCFQVWPGPRVITIRDGRVLSATDTTGTRSDTALVREGATAPAGIDALFDRIATGIRDTTIDMVRVEYDRHQGFPTHVTFDRYVMASDDEYHLTISHLTAPPTRRE